ncbi:MAG: Xaa-Pro peptidase family protein [Anaerolineae bacterium]|nr:Xaa-Pro peptidase family protein [Anaerolineae bacterium]
MAIDYNARLQKLLDTTGHDVVALMPGPNMLYFTGLHYHLSERPIIAFVSKEGLSFIVPQLEVTKLTSRTDIEAQAFDWSDSHGYEGAFKQAIEQLGLGKGASWAADGMTMRVFEWLALEKAGADMGHSSDVGQDLLMLRAYKTPEEIELMREAIKISEEALQRTIDWVTVGKTEREIAKKLESEMSALGGEGLAFGSLVLTGEKTALPHGTTAGRQLQENEFLLFDFGASKSDYPADITRTFCIGTPSDDMRKVYDTVLAANQAAHAISKPGVTCHEVDKAARDVIEAAGYGEFFTHRLGHGLGLSGHELPNIAPNNHTKLEIGMVFTIEPGIYQPGVGGVRIEDDVVVTENGIESLTTFPRDLQ